MASLKTIPAAFVVFLCLCSQALAIKDFDYYSLVLMWPASHCYETSAGCCLPTTGKPALDFFITGLQTHNSTTVDVVANCKQSNFNIKEVMYDKYLGRSPRFAFVTMRTVEDANAAIEKLNGTEIGGREIKLNVTEKLLQPVDMSLFQSEESKFMDSPHKVYVGNLAKTVTTESLTKFFSGRGKVLGARVSRSPGASNSKGFGFCFILFRRGCRSCYFIMQRCC